MWCHGMCWSRKWSLPCARTRRRSRRRRRCRRIGPAPEPGCRCCRCGGLRIRVRLCLDARVHAIDGILQRFARPVDLRRIVPVLQPVRRVDGVRQCVAGGVVRDLAVRIREQLRRLVQLRRQIRFRVIQPLRGLDSTTALTAFDRLFSWVSYQSACSLSFTAAASSPCAFSATQPRIRVPWP